MCIHRHIPKQIHCQRSLEHLGWRRRCWVIVHLTHPHTQRRRRPRGGGRVTAVHAAAAAAAAQGRLLVRGCRLRGRAVRFPDRRLLLRNLSTAQGCAELLNRTESEGSGCTTGGEGANLGKFAMALCRMIYKRREHDV